MKILHVAHTIRGACGVSCFVMEIAREQAAAGHDVCIVTSMLRDYPQDGLNIQLLDDPTQIDFVPDIVHLHSIWNLYVHKMAVWSRKRKIPYICSPHGTLTPWALKFKWWKKLPAMLMYQYHDLKKALAFHVTADAEAENVRRLKLKQSIIKVPLGVSCNVYHECPKEKTVLFIGRVHPQKGIEILLQAWSELAPEIKNSWRLLIAGTCDADYLIRIKKIAQKNKLEVTDLTGDAAMEQQNGANTAEQLRKKLAQCGGLILTGPVYGEEKNYLYAMSSIFILPSFSENFGAVVLEALAAGTPVITTTGTPWQDLEKNKCGWWVPANSGSINTALTDALLLSSEAYSAMAQNARDFIADNYTWDKCARQLSENYMLLIKTESHSK